ncbi:hypothetical protein L7F22_057381 [Adiantum nelumboides]|nr:hypothetical protein [Adiantum nelumboides]
MAQRTIFIAFAVGRARLNSHGDTLSKEQVMYDLFGPPSSSEGDVEYNEDDESEDMETENVLTHESLNEALESAHNVDANQARDVDNANKHVAHQKGASSRKKSYKRLQKNTMVGLRKYRKE